MFTFRSTFHPLSRLLTTNRWVRGALITGIVIVTGATAWAIVLDLGLVADLHDPQAEHADQWTFSTMVSSGQYDDAFELAFEQGDELFATAFNALDGVGANVGDGQRFTRVPRADLYGSAEWATHTPSRTTGPNAQACSACHNQPFEDGAGSAADNVHRDPLHSGNLYSFIHRNTPHLFAAGAIQRLAEEMTETLHDLRSQAIERVCARGGSVSVTLEAKGIYFGTLRVTCRGDAFSADIDTSGVIGIDADLVVRPFQWKGSRAFLRDFNRDASHNELGMQSVELVGDGIDGDGDGVVDEMSIGDQTALSVYLAAQPRPVTLLELDDLGLVAPPLTSDQKHGIGRGRSTFERIGCASCHVPELRLDDPVFNEPSQNPDYRDPIFPGGQDPLAVGVDPALPVEFDLTADQPDNRIEDESGNIVLLGSLKRDREGRGIVELFGDLRRHDLGPGLAENIDEIGTGASVFLTENLWGVSSTAPYLHDGRATTLTEAILAHGGEAERARDAFVLLSPGKQRDVIAFLENLVLFKLEEEQEDLGRQLQAPSLTPI